MQDGLFKSKCKYPSNFTAGISTNNNISEMSLNFVTQQTYLTNSTETNLYNQFAAAYISNNFNTWSV